jgi:hypothetical protein
MKTAVEWLVEEMFKQGYFNDKPLTIKNIERFVKQANKMFEEQIMNCCIQTTQDCYIAIMEHLNAPLQFTDEDLSNQKLEAEQYYNETFKS